MRTASLPRSDSDMALLGLRRAGFKTLSHHHAPDKRTNSTNCPGEYRSGDGRVRRPRRCRGRSSACKTACRRGSTGRSTRPRSGAQRTAPASRAPRCRASRCRTATAPAARGARRAAGEARTRGSTATRSRRAPRPRQSSRPRSGRRHRGCTRARTRSASASATREGRWRWTCATCLPAEVLPPLHAWTASAQHRRWPISECRTCRVCRSRRWTSPRSWTTGRPPTPPGPSRGSAASSTSSMCACRWQQTTRQSCSHTTSALRSSPSSSRAIGRCSRESTAPTTRTSPAGSRPSYG